MFRPCLLQLEDRITPALTLMNNFAGLDFPRSGGSVPPDTTMAVGPNHVIEAVNTTLAIYNKSDGRMLSQSRVSSFFAPVQASANVFDPVVVYDDIAGRFIVVTLDVSDADQSAFVEIAVSNSSDPTQGFTEIQKINVRQFSPGLNANLWGDYPKVGYNARSVVVTLNMFSFPTTEGRFDHVQIVTIDKSTLLDANRSTLTLFQVDRSNTFTSAAAVMHGADANDPMWLVEALGGSNIRVTRMSNELSNNPTFQSTSIRVESFTGAPNSPQPGQGLLDTGDTRILNAEFRNDRLVATHTVGIPGDSASHVRWYEFNTTGAAPVLAQQSTLRPGAGIFTWSPAVSISADGSIGLTYIQASATEFMSMYVGTQGPQEPRNALGTTGLFRAGQAVYNAFDGSPFRTGDYAGIGADPNSTSTFWAANQFATSTNRNNWGTWIGQFTVSGFNSAANERYVQQVYRDILQRQADMGGLGFFTDFLNRGGSRATMVRLFVTSAEYRVIQVRGYYQLYLGRQADPGGLNGLVGAIAGGATLEQVQNVFTSSQEYFQRNGGTSASFVDALYRDVLGRPADQGGRSFFINALANGASRSQVSALFFLSDEFRVRLVQGYFQQFLRRPADGNGLSFFVGQLRNGVRDEEVIVTLVSSAEYFNRM